MTSQKVGDRGFAGADSPSKTNDEHAATVPSRFLGGVDVPGPPQSQNAPAPTKDSLVALSTAVRWGTTTVGLLWAAALRSDRAELGLGVVLLAYALWRTYSPIQYRDRGWRSLLSILTELLVTVGVTVSTGCWDSPYIFVLFTPIIAAGFARGFWHAFRIGITAAIAVGAVALMLGLDSGIRPITAWGGEFLMVAAIASYGSRLMKRAEEVDALNLSQVWRLNEANSLLMSLNRLAHDIPVSFDFHETTANALERVKEATEPDLIALLLLEPLSSVWSVAMAEGGRLPESFVDDHLPVRLREAAHDLGPRLFQDLDANPGLKESSRSAIYLPLWAGTRQVGLLAVESDNRAQFGAMQMELLKELAEPVALTIDNARWFDRLRARGAAQERTRIARDLHDRVGQGVAYVAFELDRISRQAQGTEIGDEINHLRDDARSMVSELRETLYDLRTDVSDERSFDSVVAEFLGRVGKRSKLEVSFHHDAVRRIALAQEREVWRICQEAVINVERHADARQIDVVWEVDDRGGALLTITDDGVGLHTPANQTDNNYADSGSPGRPSYGLTGMRERAESIGGVLEISSGEHGGTVVRLSLGTRQKETL